MATEILKCHFTKLQPDMYWADEDSLLTDRHMRAASHGKFGMGGNYHTNHAGDVFRKMQPLDEIDSAEGRLCSKSGLWYPKRGLVNKGGRRYGIHFVPRKR